MESVQLRRIQNPVRGLLHGSAAVVSVAGLALLLSKTNGFRMTLATAIYGCALIGMYVTSSLYHSVPWRPDWKARFQKLDHTLIYILVAATFTPLVVGTAPRPWMILGLIAAWGLVIFGIGREIAPHRARRVWTPLQVMAVVAVLAPFWITLALMEPIAAWLTVGGGVVYLFGVLLFVNNRPRLNPPLFSHHEFFHVLVIVASTAHFAAVWRVLG